MVMQPNDPPKTGRSTNRLLRRAELLATRMKNLIALRSEEYLVAGWHRAKNNWGDILNPFLIQALSNTRVVHVSDVFPVQRKPFVYSVIGSILGDYPVDNLIVWGSGFIDPQRSFRVRPSEIRAVRGPLTRERVLQLGLHCPKVFGDPALLLPRFLQRPRRTVKYELGIIPHFVDQNCPQVTRLRGNDGVLIIDIRAGVETVVDQILSCSMVASSSLHGIIGADAYGVPSVWVEFSENVIGGGFKFRDYFESVGRNVNQPLIVGSKTTIREIMDHRQDYTLDVNLDALYDACPFKNDDASEYLRPGAIPAGW